MKNFTKNTFYISVAVIVLAVGVFAVLPSAPSVETADDFFVNSVEAFAGGEDDGQGGCCGGGEGGDPDPDPEPDAPDPDPAPTCDLSLSTEALPHSGGSVTATWTSNNVANDSTLWIGNTEYTNESVNSGSKTVTITEDTRFRFDIWNDTGFDTCEADITVEPPVVTTPAPVCNLSLSTTRVPNGGGYVGLVWTSNNVANDSTLWVGNTEFTNVDVNTGARQIHVTEDTRVRFDIWNDTGFDTCEADITVEPPVAVTPAPICDLDLSRYSVPATGGVVTMLWTSNNVANDSTLWIADTEYTDVDVNSGSHQITVSEPTHVRFDIWNDTGFDTCEADITVEPPVTNPSPSCDLFNVSSNTLPVGGGDVTITWNTSNTNDVRLNGVAVANNDTVTRSVTTNSQFEITVDGQSAGCAQSVTVQPPVTNPSPSCDLFTVSSNTVPEQGGEVTLTWNTSNTNDVRLNGVAVANDDTVTRSVTTDTQFEITVDGQSAGCAQTVSVDTVTPPVFSCSELTFEANGSASDITVNQGSTVDLSWAWTGNSQITNASVDGGIGIVNSGETKQVVVNNTITYTTTITDGTDTRQCPITIDVQDTPNPDVFTCENNVTFTASETLLDNDGGDVTLNWNVTGADLISINGVASTNLSDSEVVNVRSDTTYTLVASKAGFEDQRCSVEIEVETGGGGGGGSSSPKCELFEASDTTIRAGEEITLEWETRRGRELTIYEGTKRNGDKIYDTDDNDDVDEGSIKVRPLSDTTYTLVVERGSKERTCDVDIEIENDVVVLSDRNQEPRVAGIALTAVPYTGFEAGPALTILFYVLLTLWGLFVAYTFAIKGDSLFGFSFAGILPRRKEMVEHATESTVAETIVAPVSEAAAYVASEVAAPTNLPTGIVPTIGYSSTPVVENAAAAVTAVVNDDLETMLENKAHGKNVLLSSDAMRFMIEQNTVDAVGSALDTVIADAKKEYPTEDGWIVLNLERVQSLTDTTETPVSVTPTTAGSLAEAIVAGNIVAAYEMIASRPMIALADAATDLDTAYRARKGEVVATSDMLTNGVATLSDTQLEAAIAALTGAIDGTYTDEASAVKMAIMKAVKAVS